MNDKLTLEQMAGREADGITSLESKAETPSANDLISLKAVTELLNPKRITTNSRISKEQVKTISKLLLFGSTYKSSFATDLAVTILELQISLNGMGRQELIQLVQQRTETVNIERVEKKGIFK